MPDGLKSTYRTFPYGRIFINGNSTFTKSTEVILNLSATDNVGITGYYISTSNIIPSVLDINWVNISPVKTYTANIPYTLSLGDGVKTVYVLYKDNVGNISLVANASIILDTLLPIISVVEKKEDSITYGAVIAGNLDWDVIDVSVLLGNNKVTIVPTDISKTDKAIINISYIPVKRNR